MKIHNMESGSCRYSITNPNNNIEGSVAINPLNPGEIKEESKSEDRGFGSSC